MNSNEVIVLSVSDFTTLCSNHCFNAERVYHHGHSSFKVTQTSSNTISSFIDYSEGTSSAPACASRCYQTIQYHKHLVLLNLQHHNQQKICLLFVLGSRTFHVRWCRGDYRRDNVYSLISLRLSTWVLILEPLSFLMVKLELRKWHHNAVEMYKGIIKIVVLCIVRRNKLVYENSFLHFKWPFNLVTQHMIFAKTVTFFFSISHSYTH